MALSRKKKVKKPKSSFVVIDVPIYKGWVIVSINQTDDQFIKSYMKARGITDRTLAELACSSVQQDHEVEQGKTSHMAGNVMIRVYSPVETPEQYSTLVHELFHATDFILDYRGMKLVDGSDEAYSYLIGYLMEETMKSYK